MFRKLELDQYEVRRGNHYLSDSIEIVEIIERQLIVGLDLGLSFVYEVE